MQIQIGWLLWLYTVCKSRAYPGSAGPGLRWMVTLTHETALSKMFFEPLLKIGQFKKERISSPLEQIHSFYSRPYFKGIWCSENQTGSHKGLPYNKWLKIHQVYPVPLTLKASCKICSRGHLFFFSIFQRKQVLTFHVRGFTWNVKTWFLWKVKIKNCHLLQLWLAL